MKFFVGGYNPDLNVATLDPSDGSIELDSSVSTPENASFLHYAPEYSVLYATVETGYRTGASGKLAAYRVASDGRLTAIGSVESGGAGPCHVDVDPEHDLLAAANYGGETFTVVKLGDDGRPEATVATVRHSGGSVNRARQSEPHPHAATFSPDRAWLFVADLGTDAVMRYAVTDLLAGKADGAVAYHATPGAGPRHIAFSPDGRFAYVVTELANTVVALAYEAATGALDPISELSALPATFDGESSAAEIQVHPSGRFVYSSNRGHDSIAVFARDARTGALTPAGHFATAGRNPRHFQIDPSGAWLLVTNQDSNHVVSFRIDALTGMGTPTGRSAHVTSPSCAEFLR